MTKYRAFLLVANVISAGYNVLIWQLMPLDKGWVFADGAICALNVGAVLLILGTWLGMALDKWNAQDAAVANREQVLEARVQELRQQLSARGDGVWRGAIWYPFGSPKASR